MRVTVCRLFLCGCACLLAWTRLSAATEIDVPVVYGGYGISFYEETARQFEALRPGVTVKLYGDPRITDKVRVRIIDGDLPDATLPRDLLIPALVRAGKLRDLTPYLDGPNWEGDATWRETFLPGALDSWVVDGKPYGLPFTYACWTIFYNRALFRSNGWTEPRTWDEFFALCEKIKATGIAPLSLTGIYWKYPNAFLRSAFYNLGGPDAWDAIGNLRPGAYADPRYARAADVIQKIAQTYTLRGWEGATHTSAQLAFLEGRSAMTVSGSWMIHEMDGKIPADFEVGVMNFPIFPDGVTEAATIQASADCFFLFATGDPERERLTVDFLRFLTSRARTAAFVRAIDSPVAVRGVPVEAFSPRMRSTAELIAQARGAFNMPQVMLQTPTVRQTQVDAHMELMTGKITPTDFAARLEAAAATDRAHASRPNEVDYRHPLAGSFLLVGLVGLSSWMLWSNFKRRKHQARVRSSGAAIPLGEAFFGRLRVSVAAGFVGPAFFLYALLVLVPGAAAFAWAFTRWDGLSPRVWSGAFNFKWLVFESDLFWAALKNNLFLMAVPALVVLPLALFFAYLLHRGVWGTKVFRAIFLFPNLLGGIAATLLWMNAYEPHGGLVNASLVGLGNLFGNSWLQGFDGYPWLSQRHLYGALIPIYVWMACGFNLILYLAAMEGVDPQLYEAAELDGAPRWRQFFMITLPMIWEVVVISAVFIVISGLNAFEMIWLLTSQDPDSSTHTLGTFMVTAMFKEFEVGRATAIAVVLFALVLAGSAVVMRTLKRESIES